MIESVAQLGLAICLGLSTVLLQTACEGDLDRPSYADAFNLGMRAGRSTYYPEKLWSHAAAASIERARRGVDEPSGNNILVLGPRPVRIVTIFYIFINLNLLYIY
jgi:hypothetical protein